MTTFGTLITQVGQRLDDEAHARFSPTTVRTWLNEGFREIARRSQCLIAHETIAWPASTQTGDLPDDVVQVHRVTFTPTNNATQTIPLSYYDLADMDAIWGTYETQESSYPEFYTTWGNPPNLQVKLAPIPSGTGDLDVFYFQMPPELSTSGGDDSTDVNTANCVPQGWEDLAVDYACALASLKDHQSDLYQLKMQVFTDRLKALMDTAVRYNDNPGQIMPDLQWSAGGGGGFGIGRGFGGGWYG